MNGAATAERGLLRIMAIITALITLILYLAWQRYAHAPYVPHHFPHRQHTAFPGGRLTVWLIAADLIAYLSWRAAGRAVAWAYEFGNTDVTIQSVNPGWDHRRTRQINRAVRRHRR